MKNFNVRDFLLGAALVGGLSLGLKHCGTGDKDAKEPADSTEKRITDPYGNIELFENSRSDIKFALAFVENYYPYIYWCGEAWTTGHGLTVLYNADGTHTAVTPDTKVPTLEQSDVYKGRYLTFEVLKDVKTLVKVPMDENTLLAACVLRFCIGGKNFAKSSFLEQLNAGATGAELAKTLTGWRKQQGVPNRCYFFAAILAGKIDYSELLSLRAEGCYNLTWNDIFVYEKGEPKMDKNGFCEWDFSKLQTNLAKAKQPRTVGLNLGKTKGHINVKCERTKDIVPAYIWQEVSDNARRQANKNRMLSMNAANAAATYTMACAAKQR